MAATNPVCSSEPDVMRTCMSPALCSTICARWWPVRLDRLKRISFKTLAKHQRREMPSWYVIRKTARLRGSPTGMQPGSLTEREERWRTCLGGIQAGDPHALTRLYD